MILRSQTSEIRVDRQTNKQRDKETNRHCDIYSKWWCNVYDTSKDSCWNQLSFVWCIAHVNPSINVESGRNGVAFSGFVMTHPSACFCSKRSQYIHIICIILWKWSINKLWYTVWQGEFSVCSTFTNHTNWIELLSTAMCPPLIPRISKHFDWRAKLVNSLTRPLGLLDSWVQESKGTSQRVHSKALKSFDSSPLTRWLGYDIQLWYWDVKLSRPPNNVW